MSPRCLSYRLVSYTRQTDIFEHTLSLPIQYVQYKYKYYEQTDAKERVYALADAAAAAAVCP